MGNSFCVPDWDGDGVCFDFGRMFYDDKMLAVMRLPQGNYRFYQCNPAGYNDVSSENISLSFRSVSGKAMYIGNVKVDRIADRKGFLVVRDNRGQDLPIFKKFYKNIGDDQIDVEIMKNVK